MPRTIPARLIVVLGGLGLLVLAGLALTPVPQPTATNTFVVRGELEAWHETESADLAIKLRDDDCFYYVNRYRQAGLDFDYMRKAVTAGGPVELTVIDRSWSPLDPFDSVRPVAAITAGGQVFIDRVQR